jgi:hypothetical protein
MERGNLFWINFKTKKSYIPQLEDFVSEHSRRICEAYITTKNLVYIRGEANSIDEVDEFWNILYKELGNGINQRSKINTYFVFKRFKGLRRLSHVVNLF